MTHFSVGHQRDGRTEVAEYFNHLQRARERQRGRVKGNGVERERDKERKKERE